MWVISNLFLSLKHYLSYVTNYSWENSLIPLKMVCHEIRDHKFIKTEFYDHSYARPTLFFIQFFQCLS